MASDKMTYNSYVGKEYSEYSIFLDIVHINENSRFTSAIFIPQRTLFVTTAKNDSYIQDVELTQAQIKKKKTKRGK